MLAIFIIILSTLGGLILALPPLTVDKRDLFAGFARLPECPSCSNWHPFTGENNAYPAEAQALAEEPQIDVNNLNNSENCPLYLILILGGYFHL